MRASSLYRRLRKLEAALGSDDPRHYLDRPLAEWPDAALQRAIEMGEEGLAKLAAASSAAAAGRNRAT
jgi:hypothetical protein